MSFYSPESELNDLFNTNLYAKKNPGVDIFYNTADDVLASTSDEFDSELDALIESIDVNQLTVPTTTTPFEFGQFNSLSCGPASAFTFSSSESSYDSRSTHSESSYGYSPRDTTSNYSFDLDKDFQSFGVDTHTGPQDTLDSLDLSAINCVDPSTFNMSSSPSLNVVVPKHYINRSSFSDFGPSSGGDDFFNQLVNYGATASTERFNSSFTGLPSSIPLLPFSEDAQDKGNRKKFKCTSCTRAFDRAFNLKTHMETHNPNRVKAYVCSHGSCGRAFSRKHDLGRHVTSIHRNDTSETKSIGIGKGARRCDNCGKGFVGSNVVCDCAEVDHHHEVK